ncbi:MAG: peptidoglycan-binding domain-containing protein [Cyanobacteria bacterium P01_D01_bin.105]
MLSSPETPTALELETLREGDQGSAVAQLQAKLSELNLYHGSISGLFDTETKTALETFQNQYELSEESGFFGPQTWYALAFWSHETEMPTVSIWPAVRTWLVQLIDAAAVQPEPVLSAQAKEQKELKPGQLLFWPPFGHNHRETA